ncbi:MAG: 2,3-bisphosphoglycerate-independent phosphoglycerate mutase [Alphaproteobacteria bacterium]
MSEKLEKRPVMLCILDGWGYREAKEDNAIAIGNTPNWDRLYTSCPKSLIETSGLDVGLPVGQMGNSEVGHMNIGAGRVVMQELPKIDAAVADGSIAKTEALVDLIAKLKETKGCCHLMGLMSPGGVHSHQEHFLAMAKILDAAGIKVKIHAFLDGRDTPPTSAKEYVEWFMNNSKDLANTEFATVAGRYYAMDRDKRWDRVEKAYNAMMMADAKRFDCPICAIEESYKEGVNDEFVLPVVIGDYQGMNDGDGVLMVNFRSDRAREILNALCNKSFDGFPRKKQSSFAAQVGMTEYSEEHSKFLKTMFPQHSLVNIFGEIVSRSGLTQLRIAETEKYAHVTFFFNGGEEKEFAGEERILVPSPKVATYDLQPEMSVYGITEKLTEAIRSQKFDVIIANFANGDMVGHTGILDAAVKAVEAVDKCLGEVENAIKEVNGVLLVTADHGNCELMKDPVTGKPHTAHTVGKVPAILINAPSWVKGINDGRLADLAPTLLEFLKIAQPSEMTGKSILKK